MPYEIKPLTAEISDIFTDYLENLDFNHSPHWASCFCRFYYLDCSAEEWRNRSLETNRNEAITKIKSGQMKGYLAFDGEKCIGWCNANNISELVRIRSEVQRYCSDKKVGCTICYVIHPDYRGKGVARRLLERAIEDFRLNGYDAVMALPFEDKQSPQKQYRGTLNMYTQAGFHEIDKEDSIHVMWLGLK